MQSILKLLSFTAVFIIAACSADNKPVEKAAVTGVAITRSVEKDADENKCTAKIAVEGMTCAQMCGSKIKNCLAKLDGVKNTGIIVDPETGKPNYATLEYDQKVITEKEMITAIEKLNDGQYKVKSIEIVVSEVSYEKIEDKNEDEKKDTKSVTDKVSALNNISIAIPNVFEILTRIIQ